MKKFFTIPLVLLILLSGMHFTVATHYCGGKIAATKISFSGKEATCGMTHDMNSGAAAETSLTTKCCENEITVYTVDNNYSPSAFNMKAITQNILQVHYIPQGYSFYSNNPSFTNSTNESPPDFYLANAVSMAGICVFRI